MPSVAASTIAMQLMPVRHILSMATQWELGRYSLAIPVRVIQLPALNNRKTKKFPTPALQVGPTQREKLLMTDETIVNHDNGIGCPVEGPLE